MQVSLPAVGSPIITWLLHFGFQLRNEDWSPCSKSYCVPMPGALSAAMERVDLHHTKHVKGLCNLPRPQCYLETCLTPSTMANGLSALAV